MNFTEVAAEITAKYGSPMKVLSDCLRGFLVAEPGSRFLVSDFAAIESRVLNWLAGQEDVLEMYRGHGLIYEANAAGIYGVALEDVTDIQRLIGKISELALGFQGGKVAFQVMAKNYGVKVSDNDAERIKSGWRAKHPRVVVYWYAAEEAAKRAVREPGVKHSIGPLGRQVTYLVKGSFLLCLLPSGGVISYPYPSIKPKLTSWGEWKDTIHYKGVDSSTGRFELQSTYGGSLVENITQSVARDLLAEAMLRLDDAGYEIVMHVHDEIVCEMPEGKGSLKEMENIMSQVPAWASGLPLKAKGFEAARYRK